MIDFEHHGVGILRLAAEHGASNVRIVARAIALVAADRRKASEDLCGQTMD